MSKMNVDRFEDLRVYQDSFEAAMHIFEASKDWPKSKKYSMTDRIHRSSRPVCANISETWFKRSYPKHFASKLSDATSEAAETITWLRFAERCGYLPVDTVCELADEYQRVTGGLVKMITQSEKRCDNDRLREPPALYDTN